MSHSARARLSRPVAGRTSGLVILALAATTTLAQAPLGTALTYQGRLKDAGAPASGSYDFQFTLYDDPNVGTAIGSDTTDDWPVAAGLFTVWLDFGAGAFNGQARWLEIGVRPWDSGGSYTVLSPRQELTPTPYGLYAASAANADTVDGFHAAAAPTANMLLPLDATAKFPNSALRTGAGNGLDADLLDGQQGTYYQNASNLNAGTLADARLTANVAMLQTNQTFTGGKAFSAAPAFTAGGTPFTVSSSTLVTNLNADSIDGLDSTAFLQAVPNPLTLSGTSATHIIRGENASNTSQTTGVTGVSTGTGGGLGVFGQQRGGSGWFPTTGAGVFGTSNSSFGVAGFSSTGDGMWAMSFGTSGATHGLTAESKSTSGVGVKGAATATSGVNYGGRFESSSTSGFGAFARASATSGDTFGLWGQSDSTSGFGVFGDETATSGTTYGVYGRTASPSGRGVFGYASAAGGAPYGGYFQTQSTGGYGAFGYATATSGTTYGLFGQSDSTTGRGVYGLASAASGTNYGGYFESDSNQGTGVFASGGTRGGAFEAASTSGVAVSGTATAASSATYGVKGNAGSSSSGIGVYGAGGALGVQGYSDSGIAVLGQAGSTGTGAIGGSFESWSPSGRGVTGWASATSSTTYGGYFGTPSTGGYGVYGTATATSGTTYGGRFESASPDGSGVYGRASASSGLAYGVYGYSASSIGRGVYGIAIATGASDTPYGVRGSCSTATLGYGVYAVGDMGCSGNKPFRIDHPQDPENKYLLHYAAESPEVINFYRGTVTLDARGEAAVELPPYFGMINTSPSYQLTAVGAPMPMLHVAAEISEEALAAGAQAGPGDAPPTCSFRIAGGTPGGKVSWRVEAVRNDLRNRLHGAPVECEKLGPERDKYQHPEYYGQPAEMGMDCQPERAPAPAEESEAERAAQSEPRSVSERNQSREA